jgi:hypothetical protein
MNFPFYLFICIYLFTYVFICLFNICLFIYFFNRSLIRSLVHLFFRSPVYSLTLLIVLSLFVLSIIISLFVHSIIRLLIRSSIH